MSNKLPSLDSTDKELESIYDEQSKIFFTWLETNHISANSSRDIAKLAHNELVKRSNNRFAKGSIVLSIFIFALSITTLSFAFFDYIGDKEWQNNQMSELQDLNNNLSIKSANIEILEFELSKAKRKIDLLERRIELPNETPMARKFDTQGDDYRWKFGT